MKTICAALWPLLLVALGGCPDEGKRPLGANCTSHDECQSGVCGGGVCLDPDGDEDLDGLINKIEAGLSTDPVEGDSDGDGKPDMAEVGAIESPIDSDGDGKIDARESATADVDADCIPDELDGNDAFSDLPSEAFPNACGDGKPVGNGPKPGDPGDGGSAACRAIRTHLGGTCAEPVGIALAECFDPKGCMSIEDLGEAVQRIVFENGAYLEQHVESEVIKFVSSSGKLCAEADLVTDAEDHSVYTYTIEGRSWTLTVWHETGAVEVVCADGTKVTLTSEATAAIGACQGSAYEFCDGVFPTACTSDAECGGGTTCCFYTDTVAYCVPPEQCPN